ncbi:MAG: LysM peptidoglycan-binding domain-containing protein [Anaerolineales bacterium]|nr:LysM peptidoglycan-binding domain-containing protein [Anaerolineales bacterium]
MLRPQLVAAGLLIAALFTACTGSAGENTPQPSAEITEYALATATATLSEASTPEFELPTATPYLYTVVENDTLFGIAARLNITLEALMAANPGINPQALSPGAQLLVPSGGSASTTPMPQLTPVPVSASPPLCFASAAGELTCLVLIANDGDQPMENVTGFVRLLSASGAELAIIEAVPPLNLLPAGAAMPLVAYIASPPPNWASAQAEIASAFWVQSDDSLYTPIDNVEFGWTPTQDGSAARVQGQVSLAGSASSVWVMAVAYDAAGQPVGVRRWESEGETGFDFWVYSLGADIADVQVVVEARP